MKKQFLIGQFFILLVVFFICSCKKQVSSPNSTIPSKLLMDKNFVSFDDASLAARQAGQSSAIVLGIKKKTVNSSFSSVREIIDSTAVDNGNGPSFYIFNYKGGGFVIIAADKRLNPIMAFADKGYFENKDKLPDGLVDWMADNDKNVRLIRKDTTVKPTTQIATLWAELLPASRTSASKQIDNVPPIGPCTPTYSDYVAGPLTQTTWGQSFPFNIYCPIISGQNALTGCVATAMAQVIYYWKYPSNYNYNNMPLDNSYNGYTDVAQLMSDAGQSVNMAYGLDASSAVGSITPSALKNSFHFSSANLGSYDYNTVASNIAAKQPVILMGDNGSTGHEWVCDGYEYRSSTSCTSDGGVIGVAFTYLHMNWGWNGGQNGWFGSNGPTAWSTSGGNFANNQQMVYNIHP